MITFTQMKKQAADLCGIYTNSPEMTKIVLDINIGNKLFQNAARRYYTRREKYTSLTAGRQYYQFPSDMLRVSNARVLVGTNTYIPLTQVYSENEWNILNTTPVGGTPTHYFIRGADEIGLYPTPSTDTEKGLLVSFEPRTVDMRLEDVVGKCNVTGGSVAVTSAGLFKASMINDCWFQTTDGSDGNWYKVSKVLDGSNLTLDNVYQGKSATNIYFIIGQCPQYPEEYHLAPAYYAAQQFYLMRKDLDSASMYKSLFDDLFNKYKDTYGSKTTGSVINPLRQANRVGFNSYPGTMRD